MNATHHGKGHSTVRAIRAHHIHDTISLVGRTDQKKERKKKNPLQSAECTLPEQTKATRSARAHLICIHAPRVQKYEEQKTSVKKKDNKKH